MIPARTARTPNGAPYHWGSVIQAWSRWKARVFLALADEPPALVESVARMVGALVAVVVGVLLAAATGSGVWKEGLGRLEFSQADATVAVVLMVLEFS